MPLPLVSTQWFLHSPRLPQGSPVFPRPSQPAFSALAPLQSCSQATKASDLLTKWFTSPIQFSQQLGGVDRASLLPLFMKEKTMDDRAGDLIDRAGDLPR